MNLREMLIRIGLDAGNTGGELDKIDGKADKLKNTLRGVGAAIATLGLGVLAQKLITAGDSMQNLQAQVGNAIDNMSGASAQMDELTRHANDNRMGIEAYAGSWAKMHTGVKQFGGTVADTTRFMDTLSAAFTTNGTSTQTADAALFQLAQTMGSGIVQGEEMNSLIDAQGELFQDVAKAIGGSVAGYKKLQAAGKVTGQQLMEAINAQYDKYQQRLKLMPMTVAQAMTRVSNAWLTMIRKVNNSTNIISNIASFIIGALEKVEGALKWLRDALGGTAEALYHLQSAAQVLGAVLTAGALYKGLMMLLSPLGILLLTFGLLTLAWDDVRTWMDGGESVVGKFLGSFDKWKPVFDGAVKAFKTFYNDMNAIANDFINNVIPPLKLLSDTIDMMVITAGRAGDLVRGKITADVNLIESEQRRAEAQRGAVTSLDPSMRIPGENMGNLTTLERAATVMSQGGVQVRPGVTAPPLPGPQSTIVQHNNITVNAAPGQSPRDVGNATMEAAEAKRAQALRDSGGGQ